MKRTIPDVGLNPEDRSYYYLEYDPQLGFSKPHRTWLNRKELMGKDYRPEKGYLKFSSAPIIKFERKGRKGAIPDADTMGGFCWLINERVKAIFDQVDPEGFVYCKVELDLSDFPEPCSSYWFAYFARELDCVDERQSQIFANYDEPDKYGEILALKMVPELVGNAHALRLSSAPQDTWLVDDILVQALQKEKIQGLIYRLIRRADMDIEKALKTIVDVYSKRPKSE